MTEARLRAVRHEILRQLREQTPDFLVNEHRAVVDLRRVDATKTEIQEILQRAEVYRPDDRRPERIRKRVARDFAFLAGRDEVAVVLDGPAAAVVILLLDILAGLHDFDRSHKILRRIAERGTIVDIMGRAACIRASDAVAHPLHLARAADVLNSEREVYVLKQRRMVELQRILGNRRRRLV